MTMARMDSDFMLFLNAIILRGRDIQSLSMEEKAHPVIVNWIRLR